MPDSNKPRQPTPLQADILRLLWLKGGLTVNEVHAELERERPDTTRAAVLRAMQVMASQKLLRRDESQRSHVYFAAPTPSRTQRGYLKGAFKRAMDSIFLGSLGDMVLGAMNEYPEALTREELDEVSQKIAELKCRQGSPPPRETQE